MTMNTNNFLKYNFISIVEKPEPIRKGCKKTGKVVGYEVVVYPSRSNFKKMELD